MRKVLFILLLLAFGIAGFFWDSVSKFLGKFATMVFNPWFFLPIIAVVAFGCIGYLIVRLLSNKNTGPETSSDNVKEEKRLSKRAKNIILWFSILTLGSGYLLYLALRYMFSEMAMEDFLVTFRTDGEIKAIMRGNTCVKYLMKVENYRIDPEGFDIFKGSFESYAASLAEALKEKSKDPGFKERKLRADEQGNLLNEADEILQFDQDGKPVNGHYQLSHELEEAINDANSSTLFEEIFGVFWFGFQPYRVFSYKFRWLKYGQKKADKEGPSVKVEVHAREDTVNSLYFRYTQYALNFSGIETGSSEMSKPGVEVKEGEVKEGEKTLVLVKGTIVFETVTKNPQKTLFRTAALSSAGDWLQALVREITSRTREWLGTTNWDEIVIGKDKIAKDKIDDIREEINKIAIRDYGQEITKISLVSIDLEDDTLQKAYNEVLKARKERDAAIARAEGQKATSAAPILGKAEGLAAISQIPGGKEMFMAEQLGNIRVYAPGRDGLLLSIAEEVTGSSSNPQGKRKNDDSGSRERDDKKSS